MSFWGFCKFSGGLVNVRRVLIARCTIREQINSTTTLISRQFSTSNPRYLHPILWAVVRPLAKVSAMVVGRGVRKWWQSLPKNKRQLFLNSASRNKWKILGFGAFTVAGVGIYYESHMQISPITNRRRFIAFNWNQIKELADMQHKFLLEEIESSKISSKHRIHLRVENVAGRLLRGNEDVKEIYNKEWSVTVIDSPLCNAFVLPNGQIFVYTGMLDMCSNDDQLGVILGHEIAHAILSHGAEQMSYLHLVDLLSIAFVAALWAILPTDAISLLTQWLMSKVVKLLVELPYQRELEIEADTVGIQLCAKACFDVRESSALWKKIAFIHGDESDAPEWLSTHPDHERRSSLLDEQIPDALEIRKKCNCPALPLVDPRTVKFHRENRHLPAVLQKA